MTVRVIFRITHPNETCIPARLEALMSLSLLHASSTPLLLSLLIETGRIPLNFREEVL